MKILYISNYLDDKYFNSIFNEVKIKPEQNMQKFNGLLVNGLACNENVDDITVLSAAVVNSKMTSKKFWKGQKYSIENISFWYLPFLNIKIIKQICLFIFGQFYVLGWIFKNIFKEKVLIVDGFYPIISTVAIVLCRLFGIFITTFYTDIVMYDVNDVVKENDSVRSIIKKVINIGDVINRKLTKAFIFLTKQMNNVVNHKNKPFLVVDCLVDSKKTIDKEKKCNKIKAFLYAGGLNEKYGVKLLIDSFINWNNGKYELWLCGDGDLVSYINSLNNKFVKYYGVLLNNQVLELEKKAMLLINPRFTNEEYTKYSFPSKNMEYMLSGTATLTTKLPGMGEEYNSYLYFFEKENLNGFIEKYEFISKISAQELNKKGKEAQKYVLKNKNNIIQANRIVAFIRNNMKKRD